jgi:glyoxylase-like metal-dependent hydrolase (beta-lactamase superfamily II)
MRHSFFSIALTLLFTGISQGQQTQPEVELIKVRDSIYMIKGPGGNVGVSLGEDGIFLVDDKFSATTPAILNALLPLTSQSVQFVVNTHHHGDHTGGNANMRGQGAVIFAHDNVRELLIAQAIAKKEKEIDQAVNEREGDRAGGNLEQRASQAKEEARNNPPVDPHMLPMVTFADNLHFFYNGQEVVVFHVPHAHTGGDVMVYFTESNVLHTGDAYVKDAYPFIDKANGGSLGGYISGLNRVKSMIDEDTLIIPGHGDVANIKDLGYTLSMLTFLKNRIAYLSLSGKSREEIMSMTDLTSDFDTKGFGDGFISTEQFMNTVYESSVKVDPDKGSDD